MASGSCVQCGATTSGKAVCERCRQYLEQERSEKAREREEKRRERDRRNFARISAHNRPSSDELAEEEDDDGQGRRFHFIYFVFLGWWLGLLMVGGIVASKGIALVLLLLRPLRRLALALFGYW